VSEWQTDPGRSLMQWCRPRGNCLRLEAPPRQTNKVSVLVSGAVAGGRPLNFRLSDKFTLVEELLSKYKVCGWNWNPPFRGGGESKGKIEILSTHNLCCRKVATSCPFSVFLTHERSWLLLQWCGPGTWKQSSWFPGASKAVLVLTNVLWNQFTHFIIFYLCSESLR